MISPVTWSEIDAALGQGEARRVAEEHWDRVITHVKRPFETALQEDAPLRCFLIDCLLRAELWCERETRKHPPTVKEVRYLRQDADAIRAVCERLEREMRNG